MVYTLISIAYWLALHIPLPLALQPLITLADLLPRWLVFFPLCLLFVGRLTPTRLVVHVLVTLLNVIMVLDLKLHLPDASGTPPEIRVGSYNTGGANLDVTTLLNWFENQRLDVLLLQEAGALRLDKQTLPVHINDHCHGQLCVLSRHPVTPVKSLGRRALGGWGTYAASYTVNLGARVLPLVNLHLNTPRHALETQKAPITNYRRFLRMHESQAIESMLASELLPVADRAGAIAGGDLNLTQQSSIYRRYWSDWQNSFSSVGNGLGRTKHTRLLAVRIDHILAGAGLIPVSSEVFPSMGGDHSPVVSTFSFHKGTIE